MGSKKYTDFQVSPESRRLTATAWQSASNIGFKQTFEAAVLFGGLFSANRFPGFLPPGTSQRDAADRQNPEDRDDEAGSMLAMRENGNFLIRDVYGASNQAGTGASTAKLTGRPGRG